VHDPVDHDAQRIALMFDGAMNVRAARVENSVVDVDVDRSDRQRPRRSPVGKDGEERSRSSPMPGSRLRGDRATRYDELGASRDRAFGLVRGG